MIRGVHAMFFSNDPEATRAFLRDKLGLPFFDAGEGWLIFDGGAAEIGCHPTWEEQPVPKHEFSLYCDDVDETVAELRENGVEFKGDVEDRGWGLATEILVPGGLEVTLYQRKYG